MRTVTCLSIFVLLLASAAGCGDDDSTNDNNNVNDSNMGTLVLRMTYGSSSSPQMRAMHTCDIVDASALQTSLEVSMDEVPDVAPAYVTWHEFHTASEPYLASELSIQATLPAGTYRAMRLTQRNMMQWIVDCPGIGEVAISDYNNSDASPMDVLSPTVITPTGVYVEDGGSFTVVAENEQMSTFDIQAGGTTVITWRSHFNTLDWDDANDNGEWDEGEGYSNMTLIPGETTMFGFDVEYQ